jgi:hypothetical protein
LTGKYFPLTNFTNSKQTQENLKSNFFQSKFQKTNIFQYTYIFIMTVKPFN